MNKRNVKLIVLFACGLVLIGGYYYHLFIRHPQGAGSVNIPMAEIEVYHVTNEVMIVGVGDSITAGFGASPGRSYWSLLLDNTIEADPTSANKCLKRIFPNLTATNLSQSGSTSLQHERHQIPKIPNAPEKWGIVIMTTGGNDLIHNYGKSPPIEGAMYGASLEQAQIWIQAFSNRLDRMINQVKDKFPNKLDIFIMTIYDPSDGTGSFRHTGLPVWKDGVQILEAYNRQIRLLGQRHPNVHVVELHESFLGHGLHAQHWWEKHYDKNDPYCWFADNIEDPNDRGYDAIRRLMWNAVVKNRLLK